jgi:hypothetical protein
MQKMSLTPTPQDKIVDLHGLPDKAVEAVRVVVEAMRQQESPQPSTTPEEWHRRFEAYLQEVASRSGRYPDGFVADDSRDAIYEGCGE